MRRVRALRRYLYVAACAFKRNGIAGLYNYFLGFLDMVRPREVSRAQPRYLQIEITDKCNLSCRHCFRGKTIAGSELSLQSLKDILKCFRNVFSVWIVGKGEPLVHSRIKEILRYLGKSRLETWIFTNLNLKRDDLLEELVKNRISQLHISLDATDKELFKSIRSGGDLDLVIGNIKKINQLKAKYGSKYPLLTLNFVAMKDNIRDLPLLADLAIQLKFKTVHVIKMREGHANKDYFKKQVIEGTLLEEEAREIVREARSTLAKHGLGFTIDSDIAFSRDLDPISQAQKTAEAEVSGIKCQTPWLRLHLDLNGDVYPSCCTIFSPFGNIFKGSPGKIWNSPKYRQLRRIAMDISRRDCLRCAQALEKAR